MQQPPPFSYRPAQQYPQQQYPQQSHPPPQPYPQQQQQAFYPSHYPQQPYPRDGMQVFQVAPQSYARGKSLVFWSRMMVLGGLLVGFAGCGSLAALQGNAAGPAAFGGGLLLACILVIAAAIVGTVGRRLQGRIL